jgi:hypothetical protein
MSADLVLLAASYVLNRQFTPLVAKARKVCASNQMLIESASANPFEKGGRVLMKKKIGGAGLVPAI